MQELFNQGYIVQGCSENIYTSRLLSYYGIERFFSWPLEMDSSMISKKLNEQAFNEWLCYGHRYETIPSIFYLKQYVTHCKALSIPTIVLKLEAIIPPAFEVEELHSIKYLGFDCLAGIRLSYLNIEADYLNTYFSPFAQKLNNKGLFDSYEYAEEYIKHYEKQCLKDNSLENGNDAMPVRLSIVEF